MHAQSRRVVFIIDSDDAARVTHETILRNEGYELLSAGEATRALPLLREQPPDLLLLGSKIGTLSVEKLIAVVKGDVLLRAVKLAVLAPVGKGTIGDDLLRAGADRVIPVGCAAQELVRHVVALVGRA